MDEENDNSEVVKDTIKREGKNAIKKSIMPWVKKIIAAIVPILGIVFLVLLAIGVMLLIVNTVISAIKGFFGVGDDDSTTIAQEAKGAISISQDGYSYVINDAFIDNIIESLESQAVDTSDAGLTYSNENSTDENGNIKENMLKKYVKAEVKTMFPKIGSATGVDGLIIIKRDNGQDGTEAKKLTYAPYNNFKAKVEAGDENYCQTHFSLNPENFNLCYSTANIVEEYDYNGRQTSRTVNLTMNEVEYQYMVEPYAMPINFLVSTHFIAQSESFMNDILKLQSRSKEIEITLKDTVDTTTITVDYSGKALEKVDEIASYTDTKNSSSGSVSVSRSSETDINNSNVSNYYSNIKTAKTVYINTDTELVVTHADTWIANRENTYTKSSSGVLKQGSQEVNIKNPENEGQYDIDYHVYPNPDNSLISSEVRQAIKDKGVTKFDVNSLTVSKGQRSDIIEKTEETLEYTEYTSLNEDTNLDNIQQLIDLINEEKYERVKNNLITSDEFYFKLLNQDEKSQDVEQIMRYVLYKLTGKDYGVTDLNDLESAYDVTSYDYMFDSSGDYMVDTTKCDEKLVIKDKDTLIKGIKKLYSGQKQQNLLSVVDELLEIQERYHVNAVFAIAVAKEESQCGTAWAAIASWTYNWMSLTGSYNGKTYKNPNSSNPRTWRVYSSFNEATLDFANNIARGDYYYKAGKYKLSEIAPVYGGASLETYMTDIQQFYKAVGIDMQSTSISGSAPTSGSSQDKLKYLFPNGAPTSKSACEKYLVTVPVALTTKNGTKTKGNITVHKALASDVQKVFQAAQDAGFKIYQASGYCFRYMNNGGSGKLSHHSYGVAIDINVNENYSHRGSTVYAGSFWDPSRSEFSIPRNGVLERAFKSVGWKWGGNWSGNYQDYMHFSYTGN